MKRRSVCGLLALLLGTAAFAGAAEEKPGPFGAMEDLTAWEWFVDLGLPKEGAAKTIDFVVPPAVFDKARVDLFDLRIVGAGNREIPYALRTRTARNNQEELTAKEFDRERTADGAEQLSLEFEKVAEHNEIDLTTSGKNFRRRVLLESSDDGKKWNEISKGEVVRYEAGGQSIDVRRLRYPINRSHFLRVGVSPDPTVPDDKPTITAAVVFQTVHVPGEDLTTPARLEYHQAVRVDGAPGSAWVVDLGNFMPVEVLRFTVADEEFARDYHLEPLPEEVPQRARGDYARVDYGRWDEGKGSPQPYYEPPTTGGGASGLWRRRAGAAPEPLEIRLPAKTVARRLRLTVRDDRNPPLNIQDVTAVAAVREIVVSATPALPQPLRLYFGNPHAADPKYDFAKNLPPELQPVPVRGTVGAQVEKNPTYRPEPPPFAERHPWVIYLVLGVACLALAGILGMVARETVRRHDSRKPV